jgi:hypothetical protein
MEFIDVFLGNFKQNRRYKTMAKAAITKNFKLSAQGILSIEDTGVFIENPDTSELIDLKDLFEDFVDKSVKLSINFDEDYE